MASGLNIFETITDDLEKMTDEELRELGRESKTVLKLYIAQTCNKGYSTGNLQKYAYGRYQGRRHVVFGISNNCVNEKGEPYAQFVNEGTAPVTNTYMSFYALGRTTQKQLRDNRTVLDQRTVRGLPMHHVVTDHRKAVPGKHFMEKTAEELLNRYFPEK